MPRTQRDDGPPAAPSSGFIQRRRPLGAGEMVPLPGNLVGQIIALREAAKRAPRAPQEGESQDRFEDFDPDLPD